MIRTYLPLWIKEKNISQIELSKQVGIARESISRIINGRVNTVRLDYILKLCQYFGKDVSEFFYIAK